MHRIRVAEHLGASSRRPRHPRALDDEELFIIEGSPGAQRPDGRSAKNGLKKAKTPLIAAITAIEEEINRDGDNLVDELHVRNLGSFLHCHDKHLLLHTNGRVNNLVQERADRNDFLNDLQLWEPTVFSTTGTGETCMTCTTRTLTTLSTHCNRGIAMVF